MMQTSLRMVGVSLGVETTDQTRRALQEVARFAHIAELRLDLMAEYDLPKLLQGRPCPVIVTNRPEREGGCFQGSEEERVKPLLDAIELGADYVDIEHDAVQLIRDRKQTKLVVSHHDFQGMPGDLALVYNDLVAKDPDVVKIVGMARCTLDNIPLLETLARADRPTIAIAMGEAGLISRVLALRYDSCFLTYATLGDGDVVAPGQLPVRAMHDVYCADKIGPQTINYGILSTLGVSDNLLALLNSSTREVGLDAVWVPLVPSLGTDGSPADMLRSFRKLNFGGYIVDESAQEMVYGALDDLDFTWDQGGLWGVVIDEEGSLIGQGGYELHEALYQLTGHPSLIPGEADLIDE